MRIEPTKETLRELYLKSGNQCAYPECMEVMINADGVFVGQICHIEAANPGGERYNEYQTDDERRSFENLMLMCYKHHKITDDTTKYTLEVLKDIKSKHETKFNDIAATIGKSIADWTENQKAVLPKNIGNLVKCFDWDFEPYQIQGQINDFEEISGRLESIPLQTRELFCIILKRMKRAFIGNDYVDPRIIESVANIDYATLDRHTAILASVGLTSRIIISEYNDEDPSILIYPCDNKYNIWRDVIDFCEKMRLDIRNIVIDLDFSVLDN